MRAKIIVGLAVGAYALVVLAAVFAFVFLKPASVHEVRFSSLTGGTFSTAELRGKVVLVNFWATYCGSCIAEMPKFVETHKKFAARGYDTIAVAVRQDSPQRVAEFAASNDLPFRIALDSSGAAARQFGNVRITPTTFLIDREGRVLRRYIGEPNWTEFHQLVEKALAS
jgi:peroxiredoxin